MKDFLEITQAIVLVLIVGFISATAFSHLSFW